MTEVELHIEELVLHGFAGRQPEAIGDALRERLTRLVAADTPHWTDRARIEVAFSPAGADDQTGARIADAVYGGLAR
jgi:hypothetical protein